MTAAEACALTVRITRDLSACRLLLQVALQHAHDQHVELERTKKAYHALLDERREQRRAA